MMGGRLFPLGRVLATPGALELMAEYAEAATGLLDRHASGDWGDLDGHDRRANEDALRNGARLFSVYTLAPGARLYVITEASREATTILLPEEY